MVENHTGGSIPELKEGQEKKIEEKEVKMTETDSNEAEEEKADRNYKEMYRMMKTQTRETDDMRVNDGESDGWNSSVLFSENTKTGPALGGKLIKYETEYLKDVYSKITVNQLPEKYKKKEDGPGSTQYLLYRKVMF